MENKKGLVMLLAGVVTFTSFILIDQGFQKGVYTIGSLFLDIVIFFIIAFIILEIEKWQKKRKKNKGVLNICRDKKQVVEKQEHQIKKL